MTPFKFEYDRKNLSLVIKDGKKEEKKTYSFNLAIKAKSDLHVNPILIAAAFDTYIGNLDGIKLIMEPGDDMDECRFSLHEAVMEQILKLLKANGRRYFPGKSIIKYLLDTRIEGEAEVTSNWITLKLTKEN